MLTSYPHTFIANGIVLTTCAPLLNYFGHGVEITAAILGIICLSFAGTWRTSPSVKSIFADPHIRNSLWLVACMLVCWTYSCITGINPLKTLESLGKVIGMLLGLTTFGYLISNTSQAHHLRALQAVTLLTCALAGLVIIERFAPALSGMLHGITSYARLNFAGPILIWGLPFVMWMNLKDRRYSPVFLLVVMAIAASNGRTGWVVLPVVVAGFCIFFHKKLTPAQWVLILAGLPLAFFAGLTLLGLSEGMTHVEERALDLATGQGTGRIDIWKFAATYWWDSARWWGIGIQGFRYIDFSAVQLNSQYHPHNSIIQLLLETGLIGFTLAVTALSSICYKAWLRLQNEPDIRAILTLCFLGLGGCSLFSTSLFHAWWVLFMLMPLTWALGWPLQQHD